jgi:hypothetical protein
MGKGRIDPTRRTAVHTYLVSSTIATLKQRFLEHHRGMLQHQRNSGREIYGYVRGPQFACPVIGTKVVETFDCPEPQIAKLQAFEYR